MRRRIRRIYSSGSIELYNCTISGNECQGLRHDGGAGGPCGTCGGIAIGSSGTCKMEGCTITGNKAGGNAGGVLNYGTCTMGSGCKATGNTSTELGGGIYLGGDGKLTLTDSTVSDSVAGDGRLRDGKGGGVYIRGTSTCIIERCTIAGNSADSGGSGGGVWNECTLEMKDCTIEKNTAGSGGIHNSGSCTIDHCLITGHTTRSAGGICNLDGTLTLTGGNEVRGNHAGEFGGGIYVYGPDTPTLADGDTLCKNHAGAGGDDISLEPGTSFSLAKTGEWCLEDGQMVLDNPDNQKLSDEGIVVNGKLKIDGWCFDGVGCTRSGCENTRWVYRTHGHELTDLDQDGIADFIDLKAAHVSAKVGYSWDGLPDGSTLKDGTPAAPPDGGFYFRGESVAVDKEYGKDSTIKTDGVNYGFSGWNIDEDFVMCRRRGSMTYSLHYQ